MRQKAATRASSRHGFKRADRRPQGWDLGLRLVRDDLDRPPLPSLTVSSHSWPSASPRLRSRALTAGLTGCNHPHPAATRWTKGTLQDYAGAVGDGGYALRHMWPAQLVAARPM